MSRSRYWARYDIAEDRDIMKWYNEGKGIYSIANELKRTPNAIKRRVDELLIPLQNAAKISNTPKPVLQESTLSILPEVQSKTQAEIDGDMILRLRDAGKSYDEIRKIMFAPQTPSKKGWFW
jgi:hypothetical protein